MPYTAREVSVEEDFSQDAQIVTRVLNVDPWSSRAEFLADVGGGVRIVGNRIWRQLPARDPAYPWLRAKSVKFKPLGEDPGTLSDAVNHLRTRAVYTTAVAVVTYTQPDFETGDSTTGADQAETERPQQSEQEELDLATVGWDFSARALRLPNHQFVWSDAVGGAADGLLVNSDTSVTKVMPGVQLVATRHLVPRKPLNAILGQLGRVNKVPVTIAGDTYPAESLRFDSAKATRKFTNRGAKFYELTYTWSCQPVYDRIALPPVATLFGYVGWNRLFDPRAGYWRYVRDNTAQANLIYRYDEDGPTQSLNGRDTKGFALLFHPAAA